VRATPEGGVRPQMPLRRLAGGAPALLRRCAAAASAPPVPPSGAGPASRRRVRSRGGAAVARDGKISSPAHGRDVRRALVRAHADAAGARAKTGENRFFPCNAKTLAIH